MNNIENLVKKSIYVLREAKAEFKHPCVLWSTGKDSTAVLSLIKEAFFGEIPWDVVHIDTGWQFKEIYEFRDKLQKDWGFNLVVAKSPLAGKINPTTGKVTHFECCTKLKTEALRNLIEEKNYDAVVVSIRRDEHTMRNIERVFSPRDRNFEWKLVARKESKTGDAPFDSLQPTELWDLYRNYFVNAHHVRVHPILHWTEIDIWKYVKDRNLPVNPLYFAKNGKRYRSLGCRTCTEPFESDADTIDKIIQEISTTKTPERAGRKQDKEVKHIMRRLRALGYM